MSLDFSRQDKIAKQIGRTISNALLRDANDPRFKQIGVTRVEVAPDLSFAKIYYNALNNDAKLCEALNKAKGFFRSQLAEKLNLRITPNLKFIYDDSLDKVRLIQDILKNDDRDK